jgi:hypothetical protein
VERSEDVLTDRVAPDSATPPHSLVRVIPTAAPVGVTSSSGNQAGGQDPLRRGLGGPISVLWIARALSRMRHRPGALRADPDERLVLFQTSAVRKALPERREQSTVTCARCDRQIRRRVYLLRRS